MACTDSELVGRCKQGHLEAWSELLHRHREHLYRVTYAILGDHDQTEDVLQEAFVKTYGALGQYDETKPFAPWMRRITVNCALLKLRKQKRESAIQLAE